MFVWGLDSWFGEPDGSCIFDTIWRTGFLPLSVIFLPISISPDVETGYKASRAEIAKNMIIQSSGFGFEIEFVAKCQKIGAPHLRGSHFLLRPDLCRREKDWLKRWVSCALVSDKIQHLDWTEAEFSAAASDDEGSC